MDKERGVDTEKIVHFRALSACIALPCEWLRVVLLPRALVQAQAAAGELHLLGAHWHAAPLRFFVRYQSGHVLRFVERASRIALNLRP